MREVFLRAHPQVAREVAQVLLREYEERGIFGRRNLPEDIISEQLPKDTEQALRFITFTVSLDYMRNASELWENGLKTLKDEEVNWIFSPSEVARRDIEDLKRSMLKHGLAKKQNRDPKIWQKLALSFLKHYDGKIEKLFLKHGFDAIKLERELKALKADFPNISGKKMLPHWLRIVQEKLSIPIANIEKLEMPIDVHVVRATFSTGCITGRYSSKGINESLKKKVADVWKQALNGTSITPLMMFRPLWLLSKYGCRYRKDNYRPKFLHCPVSGFCVDGKVKVSSKLVEIETGLSKPG